MIDQVISTLKELMNGQGKTLDSMRDGITKLVKINDNIFDYYLEETHEGNLTANLSKYDPTVPLLTIKNPQNTDLALLSIQWDLEQNIKDNGNFIITNDGVMIYKVSAGQMKYMDTVYLDLKKGLRFKANKEIKIYGWTGTGSAQKIFFTFRWGDYCK